MGSFDLVAIHCGSLKGSALVSKWLNIVSKQSLTSQKFHYPTLLYPIIAIPSRPEWEVERESHFNLKPSIGTLL